MAEFVPIELEYEHFLSSLFGSKSYHGYTDQQRFVTWRKDLVRVIKNLRRSIESTVNTDPHHMSTLLQTCDRAIESVGSAHTASVASNRAIQFLASTAFMLVGHMPNYFFEDQPTHRNYWILDGERQIGYTQSMSQKARVIRNREKCGASGMDSRMRPLDAKYREFGCDPVRFVEWIKENHPNIYLEYF